MPLLGTSVEAIDLAEDRGRFGALLARLGYKAPPTRPRTRSSEALERAAEASASRCWCARPTCSAAARWRSSTRATGLADYLRARRRGERPAQIFLDRFLENAIEVDVDALCDGERRVDRRDHAARRGGRRPLRRLGLRAAAALARRRDARARSARATRGIALRLGVVGLLNVQFARRTTSELYVIEANPRASRTVPFVSKAIGVPLAKLACRIMLGERIADLDLPPSRWPPATTSRSRRRCCRSTASRAPTRCSAPRCARPAR